mmetsp:Transcript_8501/g.12140  ORF Transcript_8501/g.12140 Transcript_8501/m.12140 type:complete len:333 (+) Transcript_8501:81-1079(+)
MSDTAAFFAKKKKKKSFKGFNANKIDASSVTNTVHVDAPALSTNNDVAGVGATLSATTLNDGLAPKNDSLEAAGGSAEGDQWDDAALAATLTKKPTGVAPTEKLLDMKALETSKVDDNIAEKMRVEEIKAQLKAAKEGMEREAERIKQEEDQKKEANEFKTAGRFGAAASGMSGGEGGKYVPRHLRGGGGGMSSARPGWGAGVSSSAPRNVDTKDENLFPDLATADNILEQQKKQELAEKKVAPKKQPLPGASWAARRAAASSTAPPKSKEETAPPAPTPVEEKKPEKVEEKPEPVAPKPATGSAAAAAAAGGGLKKKKKKKKDLSTFKPSA